MKKKMVSTLVSLQLLIVVCEGAKNLKLKQVLILSRHNIRYPLEEELNRYSPNIWPAQVGPPGNLTPKGAQQEAYLGEYFSEWFKQEKFLTEECPDENTVFVYANTESRTKATARAFIDTAFKGCNVTVHHKNTTRQDPLFNCVIHNTTKAYKDMVIAEMIRKLQNNSKLTAAYSELNKILEIEGSDVCKRDGICDLTKDNNTILYKVGHEVLIDGPLEVASLVVDAFIMNFYNGVPIQDIAWGQITTLEKWKVLIDVILQDHIIRFTIVAKDVAGPLVKYLTKIFKNYDRMPKLMLLVGHDTNINTVTSAIGFQSIDLPNQFEKYPIGGKLVFQRWTDGENEYLKVEYVYPSWSQIRNGSKYSLENPPQRVVMRLKWCNTDEHGFCPWKEFIDKLYLCMM